MLKLIKYILITTIFLTSFGADMISAFAYSVQELELRFKDADYDQVIDEALDNIRFDPHDKISLEFLQRAKKANDDLSRAERYLKDGDLRSALIVYMKLKAKSPQAVYLTKIINDIQSQIRDEEMEILDKDFDARYEGIEKALEEQNFELAQSEIDKLSKFLNEFKYQDSINSYYRNLKSLNERLNKDQAAYEEAIKKEEETKAKAKLLETLERRLKRAQNYFVKGELDKAQRTIDGMYLREHEGRAFASIRRDIERLTRKIARAQQEKLREEKRLAQEKALELKREEERKNREAREQARLEEQRNRDLEKERLATEAVKRREEERLARLRAKEEADRFREEQRLAKIKANEEARLNKIRLEEEEARRKEEARLAKEAAEEKARRKIELEKRRKKQAEERLLKEKARAREEARLAREKQIEEARLARIKAGEEAAKAKEEAAKAKEDARIERLRLAEEEKQREAELKAQRLKEKELLLKQKEEEKLKAARRRKLKLRMQKQRNERLRKAEEGAKAQKAAELKAKKEAERAQLAAAKAEMDELIWQLESFETANDYENALSLLEKIKIKDSGDRRVYTIEKRILRKRERQLAKRKEERKRHDKERKAQEKNKQEELFGAMQESFDVAIDNDDVLGAQDILSKMKATFSDELSQAILLANESIIRTRKSEQGVEYEKSQAELDDVKFEAACDDIRRSIEDNDFMIARARLVVLKKQNAENAEKLSVLSDLESRLHEQKVDFDLEEERRDQQAKLRKIEILIAEDKYEKASAIAKRLLNKYPENKKFINISKLIERQRQRLKDLCGERCPQVLAKEKVTKNIIIERPELIEDIKKTDYKDYINGLEKKVHSSIENDRKTAKEVLSEKSQKEFVLIQDEDLKQTLREIKRMINRKDYVKAFDTSMVLKQQYSDDKKVELYHQLARTHMRHLRLEEAKARELKEKEEKFKQELFDAQLLVDAEKYREAIVTLEKMKNEYPANKQVFKLLRSATVKDKELKKIKRRELKQKLAKRKRERSLKAKTKKLRQPTNIKDAIDNISDKLRITSSPQKPSSDVDTRYFDEQIRRTQSLIKRHNVDTAVFEREIKMLRSQILKRDLTIADNSLSKIRTVYKAVKGLDKQMFELEKRLDEIAKTSQIKQVVKLEESKNDRVDRARKLRNDRNQRLDKEIDNYERTIKALIEAEDFPAALNKINDLKTDERFGEKAQAVAAETTVLYKKSKSKYDEKLIEEKLNLVLAEAKTLKASGRLQTAKKTLDDNKSQLQKETGFVRLYEQIESEIIKRHEKAKIKRERRLAKLRRDRERRARKEALEKEREDKRLALEKAKEEKRLAREKAIKEKEETRLAKLAKQKADVEAKKVAEEEERLAMLAKRKLEAEKKEAAKQERIVVKKLRVEESKTDKVEADKAKAIELSAIEIEKKEERKTVSKLKEKKRLAKLKLAKDKRLKAIRSKREKEEKEAQRLAEKSRLEQERIRAAEERRKKLEAKELYIGKLYSLENALNNSNLDLAAKLIEEINAMPSSDGRYKRLLSKYDKIQAKQQKEEEERRRERRELIRKKSADQRSLDAARTEIESLLEISKIEEAYSVLDKTRAKLLLNESKDKLSDLQKLIDERYQSVLEAKFKEDSELWKQYEERLSRLIGKSEFNQARELLLELEERFAANSNFKDKLIDLKVLFDRKYQSQLQMKKTDALQKDTEHFRGLLANNKFSAASKFLLDMRRNYGAQDIILEFEATYKEEYEKHEAKKIELRQQRFQLLVKETKSAIAELKFAKARERIKLLKTLYIEKRDQLKIISSLDKELALKLLEEKKNKLDKDFAVELVEVDKAILDRDYNAVLVKVGGLFKDFPQKRAKLKSIKQLARKRLKEQKAEAVRLREQNFNMAYADLEYLIEQNKYDAARTKLNGMFDKYDDQKDYTDKLLSKEEELYSAEIDFYENDHSAQLKAAHSQLDSLLAAKDWVAMKKRIRELQKIFPLEDSIVDYLAKLEQAKLEDNHLLKQKLRSRIDERIEETSEELKEEHRQNCMVFETEIAKLEAQANDVKNSRSLLRLYADLENLYKNAPDIRFETRLDEISAKLAKYKREFEEQLNKQQEDRFDLLCSEFRAFVKTKKYYLALHKLKTIDNEYANCAECRVKIELLRDELNDLEKRLLEID